MADNVVSLAGAPLISSRRAEFLERMAAAFDKFEAGRGEQPDATVIVLCGLKQDATVSYLVQGESRGGGTSILAFAQTAIMREILLPEDD